MYGDVIKSTRLMGMGRQAKSLCMMLRTYSIYSFL